MSKVLDASCDETGKVKVGDVIVSGAIVTSEGKQASTGVLIIEEGKAWYIPSSALDLKASIGKTVDLLTELTPALTTIATALTAIGAVPAAAWVPPPTIPANVTAITARVTALTTLKAALETLKGALK